MAIQTQSLEQKHQAYDLAILSTIVCQIVGIQYESSVKWYLNSNGSRVSMVVADIMAPIWRQVIYKYQADLPAGTTSFWRDNDIVITSYVRWVTAFGSNVTSIQIRSALTAVGLSS